MSEKFVPPLFGQGLKIAVDFDGTIVDHEYPAIGRPKLFAFETLIELQKRGHMLVLWTFRSGKELQEAVDYCHENGVEFYAVNANFPEEVYEEGQISRKINADIFIDDRNIGGFWGWDRYWRLINKEEEILFRSELDDDQKPKRQKKGFFRKLFGG